MRRTFWILVSWWHGRSHFVHLFDYHVESGHVGVRRLGERVDPPEDCHTQDDGIVACRGFVAFDDRGAVAVGGDGVVWSGWRDRLVRWHPRAGETGRWAIPKPPENARDVTAVQVEETPSGMVSDGADGVWMIMSGIKLLYRFDAASARWFTHPLESAPDHMSTLVEAGRGKLMFNAPRTKRFDNETTPLHVVDTASGRVTRTGISAWSFFPLDAHHVAVLDYDRASHEGPAGLFHLASGRRLRSYGNLTVGNELGHRAPLGGTANTVFGLDAHPSLGVDLVSMPAGRERVRRTPFPVEIIRQEKCIEECRGSRIAAIGPVRILVDEVGDVWVMTSGHPYPDLYRLDR